MISPIVPLWFEEELNNMAGFVKPGKPRLRVIWAANHLISVRGRMVPMYADSMKQNIVAYRVYGDPYINEKGIEARPESIVRPSDLGGRRGLPIYEEEWEVPLCFVLEQYAVEDIYRRYWDTMRFIELGGEHIDYLGEPELDEGYIELKILLWHEKKGMPLHARPLDRCLMDWIRKIWYDAQHDPLFKLFSPQDIKPPYHVLEAGLRDLMAPHKAAEEKSLQDAEENVRELSRSLAVRRMLTTDKLNAGGGKIVGKNPQLYKKKD